MRIITDKPVAIDSRDHIRPLGTKQDNSTSVRFNQRLYELIPARDVRLLDLGCAGGGLVKSILDDGGFAVGIEGSDYNRINKRAAWSQYDGCNLFTADLTEPLLLELESSSFENDPSLFNVVTAWEFFEHIPELKISQVCANISRHLAEGGFIVGSICQHVEYHHVTVKPVAWWYEMFALNGFKRSTRIEDHFERDRVRYEGFCVGLERT